MSDYIDDPTHTRVGGDMTFGHGGRDFQVDNPVAVAQAVLTRLLLFVNEWYLNLREGTPWFEEVLGHAYRGGIPDAAIRARIVGTPFVTRLYDFASNWNPSTRVYTVSAKVITAFGQITEAPAGALMSPTGSLVIPLPTVPVPCPDNLSEIPMATPRALLR